MQTRRILPVRMSNHPTLLHQAVKVRTSSYGVSTCYDSYSIVSVTGDENLTPGVDPAVATNLARKLVMKTLTMIRTSSCLEIILQTLQHYTRRVKKKASVYDDDEDLGLGEADSAVEDAAADPDLHFEPSLLEAVGGVGALARNVLTDINSIDGVDPILRHHFPTWRSLTMSGLMHGLLRTILYLQRGSWTYRRSSSTASTASGSFFVCAPPPPQLWENIAGASDDYFLLNLDQRVAVLHAKQQARHRKDNNFEMKSPDQIKDRYWLHLEFLAERLYFYRATHR
ncbi:hypothetical protein GQ600_22478 [Phytophthora cactorum]|nr:hypothetical protein GQ600_22478 [Phytophthora cactorum]